MKKSIIAILTIFLVFMFSACSVATDTENSIALEERTPESIDENNNDMGYEQINQIEAKTLMDNESGYIILDVRTEEEFNERHIPGAILIPVGSIGDEAPPELPDKDQLILVYCRSGRRSKDASKKLAALGYTNIKEFGGINDWAYGTVTENKETDEDNSMNSSEIMEIIANDVVMYADFADNSSAEAFKELLSEGSLTVNMSDYGNFEKVGDIGTDLPRNDEQITTDPGDIILYLGNKITIYYDTNSWNFTKLGKITSINSDKTLKEVLGEGDVSVKFSLISSTR